MRYLLVLLVLVGCCFGGGFLVELDEGWVFRAGDDSLWSGVDVDGEGWRSIKVGVNWEEAGYPGYDGYGWYRLRFDLPARPKDAGGFVVLSLGYVDDVDVTYFNGVEVGSTGVMGADYFTAYKVRRRYHVPVGLVRWGGENVIAVKVYDHERGGGLYDGAITLESAGVEDMVGVGFDVGDWDGIAHSPGRLAVRLKIVNKSGLRCDVRVDCLLFSDKYQDERVPGLKKFDVELGVGGEVYKTVKFSVPGPGFYKVVCTCRLGGKDVVRESMVFGYDPLKIETALTCEDDFDSFWAGCRKRLDAVDPEFKVTKSDRSTDELDVYLVEMRSYGNVRVRGWYTVPTRGGPHAAILSVPGYTSTMWPNMGRKNVATFALNPRGHGNSKDDLDPKGAEYMYIGFDKDRPEEYVYAGAYMDCVRAVDFLMTRGEIDKKRIGVEGGSQGGGLSFASAALDERIMFSAPDIPWLGDWVGYVDASDWPSVHYPELIARFDSLTFDEINRLLSYFDTMNLAGRITCPVLMSVGLQDDVCPPRNSFATYNAVRSKKEYRVYPFAGHGVYREHGPYKDAWMARMLGVEATGL